ncbi:MAG: YitT family protein [Muribaculaceae bacterium]|nr:YitT family protein [Muribaculaceae bacterium]
MTKDNTSKFVTEARDYVMIILGLLIYAFGFAAFILPQRIVTGGVTGMASLLYYAFGWNVALVYYGINLFLLAIAFRTVGKQFVLRTIFGATMCTLLLGVLQPLFPEPLVSGQPFMSAVLGAVLCGVGIGTVFAHNGSSAGTDIIAAMVTKKSNISFGRMMLYCDLIIISFSYFLPGDDKVEKIVYGLIFLIIFAQASDMVINSNRQAVQFFIISKKWQDIANAINNSANRGCTILNGMGWYSKEPVQVVMVVCRRLESVSIFRIVKMIDPDAFITQGNVRGVYGKGFDEVKVKI